MQDYLDDFTIGETFHFLLQDILALEFEKNNHTNGLSDIVSDFMLGLGKWPLIWKTWKQAE